MRFKTSDLITAKILLNSVISTKNGRFMSLDVKDFCLNNVLPRKEHARLHLSLIPQLIIEQCNLKELVDNKGFVHIEMLKGMCSLPQPGRITSDFLLPRLKAAGHHPTARTHGSFRHESNGITFCLVVDDFGVKFTDKAAAEHLRNALRQHHTITEDWEGSNCCGLDLEWNCAEKCVDVSVKGHVEKAVQRFAHDPPIQPQHSPSGWTRPEHGAKVQMQR